MAGDGVEGEDFGEDDGGVTISKYKRKKKEIGERLDQLLPGESTERRWLVLI